MRFYDCITEFIFIEDKPQPADIIFVPGGNYPDAALHAAGLYRAGYAPYIMPSGRYSILTGHFEAPADSADAGQTSVEDTGSGKNEAPAGAGQTSGEAEGPGRDPGYAGNSFGTGKNEAPADTRYDTECDYLCDILLKNGVPEHAILREDRATFTYENAIRSRERVQKLGLQIGRAILCCQAFHARRSLMYYQEQFPRTQFLVCPVVTKGISRESWYRSRLGIDTVLGELERCGGQFHEIMYQRLGTEEGETRI